MFDKLFPKTGYTTMKQSSTKLQNQKKIFNEELTEIRLEDYNKKPFCSLASIISEDQHHSITVGTGVLISPNLILTAAHNIYKETNAGKKIVEYQDIRYLLSGRGKVSKQNYHNVKAFKYGRPWYLSDLKMDVKSDYALLLLSQEYD